MIKIQGLSKKYGDFLAVDNIDLFIQKGEIVGLLGPNGAGKSSTIRMICSYLPLTAGEILVNGISVKEDTTTVKSYIGYLPESAPLYGDMIVFDYLYYIAEIRNLPKESRSNRIREMSNLCGLNEVMHKSIGDLSKGYKQRVGLAHAMIADPEILILDEPTAGLDPNQIIEIRKLIKTIGKEKTVVLCSHILTEVEATCDRVVIINKGKIVADGTPTSLRKKTESSQSALQLEFLKGEVLQIKEQLQAIPQVKNIDQLGSDKDLKFTVLYEGDIDLRQTIFDLFDRTENKLISCQESEKKLEDVFRQLTITKSTEKEENEG